MADKNMTFGDSSHMTIEKKTKTYRLSTFFITLAIIAGLTSIIIVALAIKQSAGQ